MHTPKNEPEESNCFICREGAENGPLLSSSCKCKTMRVHQCCFKRWIESPIAQEAQKRAMRAALIRGESVDLNSLTRYHECPVCRSEFATIRQPTRDIRFLMKDYALSGAVFVLKWVLIAIQAIILCEFAIGVPVSLENNKWTANVGAIGIVGPLMYAFLLAVSLEISLTPWISMIRTCILSWLFPLGSPLDKSQHLHHFVAMFDLILNFLFVMLVFLPSLQPFSIAFSMAMRAIARFQIRFEPCMDVWSLLPWQDCLDRVDSFDVFMQMVKFVTTVYVMFPALERILTILML
eukprot:GEZU01023038.1.p1 GENE.GEZU01023038.1~~GEZU01023038.1.p1  ORF type:complete len:293 (-),score=4.97 GEZU01023038.1:31-909(-)